MSADTPQLDDYKLEDRYLRESGRVFLTGTQALVRIPLMQAALDRKQGLNTAGLVSGYRGSPLGAVDQALWQTKDLLEKNRIDFVPAINEDLAATIMLGTQQVETDEDRQVDGVFGLWYGKGPGVDRAGDALKHGTTYGSSPHGGVLVVAGDDHGCVSSSMPHQSDVAFMSFFMPTINPANIAEYLEFGLWGYALSRYSGCWVGFKAISETVESAASVEIPPTPDFVTPDDFTAPESGLHYRWPDLPGPQLETRIEHKLAAVQAFARANRIDRCLFDNKEARFGIVTTGKGHLDLLEALDLLGIDEDKARDMGLDIYKVGMVWPLERRGILDFVHGKEEVLVIEEKRGIIESQIKEYMSEPDRPGEVLITGKQDELGRPLIPYVGELSPKLVAGFLAARLGRFFEVDFSERMAEISAMTTAQDPGGVKRMPYFCSGCPHNTSTKVPEGSKALAGIGCHFMASWMGRNTESLIQMGGEGVNWIGKSRYTGNPHVFQNLGEGTYFHSGSMAIRQAVAAGINITYKILFNDAVAMTGGQPVDGQITVDRIAQQMAAEGVNRVVVLSDEPEKYDGHHDLFPKDVTFHDRSELDQVQRELRDIPGCTVLIYDQTCAAEKRRRRKRKQFPDPAKRAFINHHVCEGCGDCSVQSNCLSVVPRKTELGRKRKIDQSSCNKDFSCVEGFCPSFVTISGARPRRPEVGDAVIDVSHLPDPPLREIDGSWSILVSGVGGAGVVTIGQTLAVAAHADGYFSSNLDITGLAQKYGAVHSHIKIATTPVEMRATRIAAGEADALIGCDLVVATGDEALSKLTPGRSVAITDTTVVPTSEFSRNPDWQLNGKEQFERLTRVLDSAAHGLDAQSLAEKVMGDRVFANMLLLGAAWQLGGIPLSLDAIRRAIQLNGVQINRNLRAFDLGRLVIADPEAARSAAGETAPVPLHPAGRLERIEDIVTHRKAELQAYGGKAFVRRYGEMMDRVRGAGLEGEAVKAVARGYYKLLAIKDEWEVARLYTKPSFQKTLEESFEGDLGLTFHFGAWPYAKVNPKTGKIEKGAVSGRTALRMFELMNRFRWTRGTIIDPFRKSKEVELGHRLLAEYEADIAYAIDNPALSQDPAMTELLNLPERIRGYGHVRERHAAEVATRRAELKSEMAAAKHTAARFG